MEKLIDDGYDVRGYFYWTLIDNFEVGTLVSASLTLPLHCHCMASAPIPQSWLASHVAFGAAAVEFCVGPEVWPLRVERRWHPAPHAAKWRQGPLSSSLIAQCAHPILQPSRPVFRHCMSQAAMITALKKTAEFCNPFLHVHVMCSKWLPATAGKIAIRKTPGVLLFNSANSHRVECKACSDRRRLTEVHWWL